MSTQYEDVSDDQEEVDSGDDADEDQSDDDHSEKAKPAKKRKTAAKGKKDGKKRKRTGPKKAQSAYMFFANSRRNEEKSKNTDMGFADLARHLGALWKSLTAEEKKPYEAMAATDKIRYQNEKADAPEPDSDDESPKNKRAKKDPNAPKKPLNAYMIFAQQNRLNVLAQHVGLRASEVTKKLGEMWKTVSADDKKRYEQLSADAKVNYTKAMVAYTSGH